MSNMSYCRFQNTASDFDDCHDALEGLINGDEAKLSREEVAGAKKLAKRALDFLHLIAETANVDWDELEERHLERAIDSINEQAREGR